ncbi:hypothetical protein AAFN88_19165 [Pelagibius sp. CAU 1746]|uniref:hypothetical protein n=1 Tax=Pelagibius sp. CAU 1746 TaxID=3140370 RepID=UPI00325B3DE0
MFGLPSIQKLIVLAAVVAAVWYGFKFLGRLQKAREEEARLRESQGGKPARKAGAPKDGAKGKSQGGQVEDLVQCPSCGAYVQAGSTCDCGRKS